GRARTRRRQYTHFWHRFLHDRTAAVLTKALGAIPRCNATIVPYRRGTHQHGGVSAAEPTAGRRLLLRRSDVKNGKAEAPEISNPGQLSLPADRTPIAGIHYRQHARVAGRIHTMRVQPHGGVASLECT